MKRLMITAVLLAVTLGAFAGGELPPIRKYAAPPPPAPQPSILAQVVKKTVAYTKARLADVVDVGREAVDAVAGVAMIDPCNDDNR